MNKEQQQIIDEVYRNYKRFTHNKNGNYGDYSKWGDNPLIAGVQHLTKDSFIQMIKIDPEFSEKWGLKIEERELSPKERIELAGGKIQDKYPALVEMSLIVCDERDIPTKLITITYKENKIESYE